MKKSTRVTISNRSLSSFLVYALFIIAQRGKRDERPRVSRCTMARSVRSIIIPGEMSAVNFACEVYEGETVVAISRLIVNATTSPASVEVCKKYGASVKELRGENTLWRIRNNFPPLCIYHRFYI